MIINKYCQTKTAIVVALFAVISLLCFSISAFAMLSPEIKGAPVKNVDYWQSEPVIEGDIMVWADNRNGSDMSQIVWSNLKTGNEYRIENSRVAPPDAGPSIYQGKIVWEDFRDSKQRVFMYDTNSGTESQITFTDSSYPRIHGTKIIWMDYRNGNNDIYMYDLVTKTETQITNDQKQQISPEIYGNKIVWYEYYTNGGPGDVYLYDIPTKTKTKLTINPNATYPKIYGDRVSWTDNSNIVHVYEISTGKEVQLKQTMFGWTDIYADKMICWDWNGYKNIYDFSDGRVTSVVSGSQQSGEFDLNGTSLVWTDFPTDGVAVLYMAKIEDAVKPNPPKKLVKLVASERRVDLKPGGSKQVILTAQYKDGSVEDVTNLAAWSTTNASYATVNAGLVTASTEKFGPTVIKASYGGKQVAIPFSNAIKTVKLDVSSIKLKPGESRQLQLTVKYADGTVEDVASKAQWTSANTSLATVAGGNITASTVSYGRTRITAAFGGKKATVAVNNSVSVKASDPRVSLKAGQTKEVKLTATYADGSTTDVTLLTTWTSNNLNVATVTSGGITAVKPGNTTVTAQYGSVKIQIRVVVSK